MKLKTPRILITGAAGDTGGAAARILLGKKLPVRALVRADDDRAAQLRSLGAEIFVGDLGDLESVREALIGIHSAYFVYNIRPGLIEATAFFAQAALEKGVGAIVNMSQISARDDSKSHAAQNHWVAERLLDRSGVPVTHLRPTFFAQWLTYANVRHAIATTGKISLPFGQGRHAPIAAEDQARVIAAILEDPAPHQGQVYPLFGPVELSYAEIAAKMSAVLGRRIDYEAISVEDYKAAMTKVAGMPPFLLQHLSSVAIDFQNGVFAGTNDAIEKITGEPPMTVEAFVSSRREMFSEDADPRRWRA